MFYKTLVMDRIRVPPVDLDKNIDQSILKQVEEKYIGYVSKELGIVIEILNIVDKGTAHVIPEDGGVYFESKFNLLVYKPELSELVYTKIRDIAEFGAFASLGAIDGMIHISQTMDDFVSYSKDKVLTGKKSKRVLKVNDLCIARIIAISYKDIANPKIGLTMRQNGLGKIEWLNEQTKDNLETKEKKGKDKSKKKSK